MVPFASRKAPAISTNSSGNPTNVAVIGFVGETPVITLSSNGDLILGTDEQSAFSVPFNAIIESIYITAGTRVTYTFPTANAVFPFVQLYVAAPGSNAFVPIPTARVTTSIGFSGSTPAGSMLAASRTGINVQLAAGMRILIGGGMQITGTGTLQQNYYMYFTGGIALRPST
jgi:hypothetical protein